MNPARWNRIEGIFNATLLLPLGERDAFITSECGADTELRAELDALLNEADQTDNLLSESNLALWANLWVEHQNTSLTGKNIGAYTIIRPIGRGGMGEVYLARDERLRRKVALKLLPKSLVEDQDRIRRFKHEARAASAISDPNVAQVYEIGESDGCVFTAMEYVEGATLREVMARGGMTVGAAIDIATQVCSAIVAAHAQGIIHRDIKPENIMIRLDGLVKVVDFGLAKLSDAQSLSQDKWTAPRISLVVQTEPGILLGTVTYMSPEQARGQETDARTDIWSWGVVFYEMLAGKPPFHGATNSDTIAEILKSEPPLLRNEIASLLPSVTEILRQTLSKSKDGRYQSSSDLLIAISRLSNDINVADSKLPLNELRLDLDDFLDGQSEIGKRGQAPRPEGITTTQTLKRTSNSPMGIGENWLTGFAKRFWVHSWLAAVIVAGLLLFAVVRWGLVRRVGTGTSQTLEVINLTNDGRVLDAAISPDGKLLASTRITSGRQSLWVRDLTSDQEWQLLPPALTRYWGMRFTPNGSQILYVSTQPTDSTTVLSRIPVHGGSATKIAAGIEGPPTISPDGMHVAFVRTYPVQHRDALIVTTPDGGGERELAVRNHPDKFSSSGPAWSPDGKSIAIGIGRNSDAECAIASISVDGATVVERTGWQWAAIGGMAWHNSGRTLVFSARPLHKTSLQLWSLNISDRGLKQITDEDREYEEVTLSQTSSTLVTINTYEVSDVWAVSQSGDVRRLTTGGHEGADGLTTSSNAQIVFTEGEYDQSKLWGMNVDGTNRHRLTDNTGFLPFAARGGTLVAYVSTTGGTHHIWLIESDGRNNRQLTFGGGENYPTLTPDNNWVIYTSLAQGRGTLWRIPTSGGDPVQLTYEGIFVRPVVSPDGKTIACSWRRDESDKWQTAILPLDGGPPLKTFELPQAYLQIIRWTPNSRSFVYVNKKNGVQNLWEQPVDGSSPRQITNFSEDLILHYDLAPSGEFILSRGGRRRDIAMIKNFD